MVRAFESAGSFDPGDDPLLIEIDNLLAATADPDGGTPAGASQPPVRRIRLAPGDHYILPQPETDT